AVGSAKDSLELTVVDSTGASVRTLRAKPRPGFNRVSWDLRYDGPTQVALRTLPPDNAHIWEEAASKGKATGPITHWGIEGPEHATDAGVARSLADLDARMLDVELRLLSRTDLHSDDKWYVEPYKVYMNLIWLAGEVGSGAGDVAGGADYRPTDATVAVLAKIERDLAAARAAFTTLVEQHVPAFNG